MLLPFGARPLESPDTSLLHLVPWPRIVRDRYVDSRYPNSANRLPCSWLKQSTYCLVGHRLVFATTITRRVISTIPVAPFPTLGFAPFATT